MGAGAVPGLRSSSCLSRSPSRHGSLGRGARVLRGARGNAGKSQKEREGQEPSPGPEPPGKLAATADAPGQDGGRQDTHNSEGKAGPRRPGAVSARAASRRAGLWRGSSSPRGREMAPVLSPASTEPTCMRLLADRGNHEGTPACKPRPCTSVSVTRHGPLSLSGCHRWHNLHELHRSKPRSVTPSCPFWDPSPQGPSKAWRLC